MVEIPYECWKICSCQTFENFLIFWMYVTLNLVLVIAYGTESKEGREKNRIWIQKTICSKFSSSIFLRGYFTIVNNEHRRGEIFLENAQKDNQKTLSDVIATFMFDYFHLLWKQSREKSMICILRAFIHKRWQRF